MYRIQAAVISGDVAELVRVLEDEKYTERDWEWRGREGRTVLELATLLGRSSMVQSLISAGAPPNLVSAAGERACSASWQLYWWITCRLRCAAHGLCVGAAALCERTGDSRCQPSSGNQTQ